MVHLNGIRDASGTRFTTDLACTSKKVMPRKPGVSKVRATAPRSISGSARSRGAVNRSPPSPVSGGSSSRRLSQRIPDTIEWLFDDGKAIGHRLAGSIQRDRSGPWVSSPVRVAGDRHKTDEVQSQNNWIKTGS